MRSWDGGALRVLRVSEVVEGLAEEAGGAAGAVVDRLAELRIDHGDHGADERARGVVFAAVAPGVAHVLDLRLVEVGELVLLLLGAEAELVDEVEDVAQGVAGLWILLRISPKISPILYSMVSGPLARCLKPSR